MAQRRSLGKGLEALLPQKTFSPLEPRTIPLDKIFPNPDQPRKVFSEDSLQELTTSIKNHGILQPLLIAPKDDGYIIVAGERRWRAAKQAGLSEIPAILFQGEEKDILEASLIENIQRDDLSSIEVAHTLRELMNRFGLSQENVAARIGWSRSAVANKLRLLNLPEDVKTMITKGALSERHGRALLSLESPSLVSVMATQAAEQEWTVRELEKRIKDKNRPTQQTTRTTPDWGNSLRPFKIFVSVTGRRHNMKVTLSGLNAEQIRRLGDLLSKEKEELFATAEVNTP
ncbi:MAG: chromosome partitioning protein ParB [Dethiosulfovibrio peptidovorans]|nr:MAG: chromosome partitioning protein ParB [Dethiosulfovibrio peptidovorans]